MDKILHDPKDPNYGNYGIFLIMGIAGFCPSTVRMHVHWLNLAHTVLDLTNSGTAWAELAPWSWFIWEFPKIRGTPYNKDPIIRVLC